eukprot:CAMPEP_0203764852 /NCGR_PEP_ID=MMETSP0098-20131031/18094_1 /ASSEMBLY_ACC=CAM_ASM_000208 /TAXON_ID=96639 /ORGANISM=" , Strain NY0313808BC1" /LENGTH=825 /DNA_ID=CAMNT_0050661053 /DNA_START=1764 /DNA_END=4241 /DNA_ORIENTATION=-
MVDKPLVKQGSSVLDDSHVRSSVLDQVIALGSNAVVLDGALRETIVEEQALNDQINATLMNGGLLERKDNHETALEKALDDLKASIPMLQVVFKGVSNLDRRITETREMADVVSKRVREIDLARSRALEALGIVKREMELRKCLKGVKECLKSNDLEAGSAYIFKYNQAHGGADTKEDAGREQLEACEETLREAALEALNIAIENSDDESVLKVCRVFGNLGLPRVGLSRLLEYLCERLRGQVEIEIEMTTTSEQSSTPEYGQEEEQFTKVKDFAELLRYTINRGVALIQQTGALVKENISQAPDLQEMVLVSIRSECDNLISRVLSEFSKCRFLEERVKLAIQGLDKVNEAMSVGKNTWHEGGTNTDNSPTPESIHMLNDILHDVALMIQRTETYNQAVGSRKGAPTEYQSLTNVAQELSGYYSILEGTYLKVAIDASIDREFALRHTSTNSTEPVSGVDDEKVGQSKDVFVSSVCDHAFFVIDRCRDRAIAAGHIDSVCAVINHIVSALEEQVAVLFHERVAKIKKDVHSLSAQGQEHFDKLRAAAFSQTQQALSVAQAAAANVGVEGVVGSKIIADQPGEDDLEKPETTMNSLSLCIVYTKVLQTWLEQFSDGISDEKMKLKLKTCCDGFLETVELFQRTLNTGLDRLVEVFKPMLREKIDSTVGSSSISFEITEEDYLAHTDANDPFVTGLMSLTDELLKETSKLLDIDNSTKIIQKVASFLAKWLEHAIVRKKFTPFGALVLDKQLRMIVKFFDERVGSQATNNFKRLGQICDLLNLDRVEDVHDVYIATTSDLSTKEVKRVLALRVDFKNENIKRLKLG